MTDVVYVIGSAGTHLVKIGTTDDELQRLADLQRMNPLPLSVLWSTSGNYVLETALHRHFAAFRKHGEWFDFGNDNAVQVVAVAVNGVRSGAIGADIKGEPAPAKIGRPRTGRTPVRTLRVPDPDWSDFHKVTGRRLPAVIWQFIRWYLRRPGAQLPKRPGVEEIAELVQESDS